MGAILPLFTSVGEIEHSVPLRSAKEGLVVCYRDAFG
jgi:hypothetical protein